jgi:uncharacterized flavoprotein (TIGR03862 family)
MTSALEGPRDDKPRHVLVIGAGPAGLMAAESARRAGASVTVCEQMASPARKFLLAGKGGLNLTHSEGIEAFAGRYRESAPRVREWLRAFGPADLRQWAADLGYPTVVGSSGRVFPYDYKAGPLLRAWLRRLCSEGVRFHYQWRWAGWNDSGGLVFVTPEGVQASRADAVILALGGMSWAKLGSDGRWQPLLAARGIQLEPFAPSNCGFECAWSALLVERHAGAPLKSVRLALADDAQPGPKGECMLTAYGLEGSAIYAMSPRLRAAIVRDGRAELRIDLAPDRSLDALVAALAKPRGKRTLGEHLRRATGFDRVKLSLLHECLPRAQLGEPDRCAAAIKSLPVVLSAARPIDEAISCAGGVRLDELDHSLQLKRLPGFWCVGEMIDWEAPTGGYLLTACFASGFIAGRAAASA